MNSKIIPTKKYRLSITPTIATSCIGLFTFQPPANAYGYSEPNIFGGIEYHNY